MLGASRRIIWAIAGSTALAVSVWLGFAYGGGLGTLLEPAAETLHAWFGTTAVSTSEVLELDSGQMGQAEPSTQQSLIGLSESAYSVYEQVGGRRTNFQNVKSFPEDAVIRQLGQGVGRLDIGVVGQKSARYCTAFLIADKPGDTYAMTAGHCFATDLACPTSGAGMKPIQIRPVKDDITSKQRPDMLMVFRHYENDLSGRRVQEGKADAIPATLVNDEVRCEAGLDYAIVKLDDARLEIIRKADPEIRIAPVSLGDVTIKPGHQLLILSHPDGRALMATERHCLAADPPARPSLGEAYFAHYCDTLKGSSGAPVFSRDHAVVVAIHTRSQYDALAAGEENIALHISKIAAASPLLQKLNILRRNPLTAEQQKIVDAAKTLATESFIQLFAGDGEKAKFQAEQAASTLGTRSDAGTLRYNAPEVSLASVSSANFITELSEEAKDKNWTNACIFSPDGTDILSYAGNSSVVGSWNVSSGKLKYKLSGHAGRILDFRLSADGSRVVTASEDNTARLWDAHTGAPIGAVMKHEDWVSSAAFSADGSRVVTASEDNTARLWDAHTGAPIGAVMKHEDRVSSAAFSADGSRVVTASRDKTVRFWDAHTGAPLTVLRGHTDAVYAASFSPNGRTLVTASDDNTARIWDVHTGAILVFIRGRSRFDTVAYSPDGLRLLTASEDEVRIWDARSGRALQAPFGLSKVTTTSAALAGDGTRALIGSENGIVSIASISAPTALVGQLRAHVGAVVGLAVSPDGKLIASASNDNTLRIWRMPK